MCQDNLIVKFRVSSTDWGEDSYSDWTLLGKFESIDEAIESIAKKSSLVFSNQPFEFKVLKSKQDFELELNENDLGWFEITCSSFTNYTFQFFVEKSIKSPWEIGLNEQFRN